MAGPLTAPAPLTAPSPAPPPHNPWTQRNPQHHHHHNDHHNYHHHAPFYRSRGSTQNYNWREAPLPLEPPPPPPLDPFEPPRIAPSTTAEVADSTTPLGNDQPTLRFSTEPCEAAPASKRPRRTAGHDDEKKKNHKDVGNHAKKKNSIQDGSDARIETHQIVHFHDSKEGNGKLQHDKVSAKTTQASQRKNAASSNSNNTGNRRETDYTAAQRMRILEELNGPKAPLQKAVAAKYGIGVRTLQRWNQNRATIVRQVEREGKGSLKRRHETVLDRVKQAVQTYYELSLKLQPGRRRVPPVTGTVIAQKAREAKETLLAMNAKNPFLSEKEVTVLQEFKATESWARKTASKFGWRKMAAAATEVSTNALVDNSHNTQSIQELDTLRHLMSSYGMERCYLMVEESLYFKLLPMEHYVQQESGEGTGKSTPASSDWTPCSNLMSASDRATLYVCSNATGTDKVPLTWVGGGGSTSTHLPLCFRGRRVPFAYYHNSQDRRGWSDTSTLTRWWGDFLQHIRNRTTERVLLLLTDGNVFHHHPLVDPNQQVRVVHFHPTAVVDGPTSRYNSPMQGVIGLLKRQYRFQLLSRVLEVHKDCTSLRTAAHEAGMAAGTLGLDQGHTPHVRDAMLMLSQAWTEHITREEIAASWTTAGFWAASPEDSIASQILSDQQTKERKRWWKSQIRAMVQAMTEFASNYNMNAPPHPSDESSLALDAGALDFDAALHQMALGMEAVRAKRLQDHRRQTNTEQRYLQEMLEAWVHLEESEALKGWLGQELERNMSMEAMLEGAAATDGVAAPVVEEPKEQEQLPFKSSTLAEMQAMATQLLKFSVRLSEMEPSFHTAAAGLQDIAVSVQQTQKAVEEDSCRQETEPIKTGKRRRADGPTDNIFRA